VVGHYPYECRGVGPAGATGARASEPLAQTELSDVVHLDFDVTHMGGFPGAGDAGRKSARVWMVNDDGAGYGLRVGLGKQTSAGQLALDYTDDWGVSWEERGGLVLPPWAGDVRDSWDEQPVSLVWDRVGGQFDLHFKDYLLTSVQPPAGEHETVKDFTHVVLAPWETAAEVGHLSLDDVRTSNDPRPYVEFPIPAGDTNCDGYVDIQDLTPPAVCWSALIWPHPSLLGTDARQLQLRWVV